MSKDLRRPNLPFRIPNALFTSRRATSLKKIELFLILWRVSRVSERGQKRQGKRIRCVDLNCSHFCDDWTVTENPSIVDRCKPSIKDIDQWLSCVYCKCIEEQSNWIPFWFYPGSCLWLSCDSHLRILYNTRNTIFLRKK